MMRYIDLIKDYRANVNVSSDNPYIFGLPNRLEDEHRYPRVCIVMRKFAVECGAEAPKDLRATHLRKHFARLCSQLGLTDSEIADLAKLMDHKEPIHRQHYQLPMAHKDLDFWIFGIRSRQHQWTTTQGFFFKEWDYYQRKCGGRHPP